MEDTTGALRRIAREAFGIDTWREGQFEAVRAAAEGRDVLAVMPTGHGKSAIYQVPGAARPGVTVVVSPLVALQAEQARALRAALGEGTAVVLNSTLRARAEREAWESLADGTARFVFLAPEQLAREETVARLAELEPKLFVVDEAHCISAWGHDFRPDYLVLGEVRRRLGSPPAVALTATASPHTRAEIADRLGLADPLVLLQSFDRPEIGLRVQRHAREDDKRAAVLDQAASLEGPGLVYVATRRETEEIAAALADRGIAAAAYHSGRAAADRAAVHERFLDGGAGERLDVVVATTAFGMGIDKPDVRYVVHADVPDSLDSYYQEVGRAGRDGGPALAVLHYRPEDLGLRRFFVGGQAPREQVAGVFEAVRAHGPVRAGALGELTGLAPRAQSRILNLLVRSGCVQAARAGYRASDGVDSPRAVERALAEEESRQRVDASRIEMVRGYAETDGCRRQWLLNYFGEDAPPWCGNCDRCEEDGSLQQARERAADAPEGWAMQDPVRHRDWGEGLVMGVEPDRITVLFDSVGYKELALSAIDADEELLVRISDA
ncbi:ATP-dependent DNA helicase RecQ [Sinomonas atrocyanea]|uniref:RecQ family ATP-dependent DNA helicase n=1 Tax=Sinomonas atrocyanea TaxID=37927 RepID=UPI00278038B2|nr:RecQ family ATP-dependent DNA helicase [Sinomonas atrocyanea]MDQ0259886.1 ATP-dependent DNA helicase RecQ [Sinomonas atrocyanea]